MRWSADLTHKLGLDAVPRLKKAIVAIVGVTVLLIGVALIVLPGPALVVIPIGLAILASEFAWARAVIKRGRGLLEKAGIRVPGEEGEDEPRGGTRR